MEKGNEVKFTMQQLADMALGSTGFTCANTVVLHGLLELVLKQLNCENEVVSIRGYETNQMAEVLRESSVTALVFEKAYPEHIVVDAEYFKELEADIDGIENDLSEHLKNLQGDLEPQQEVLQPCHGLYNTPSPLCNTCDPEIDSICKALASNADFKIIMQNMMGPVERKTLLLEGKLDAFRNAFCLFKRDMVNAASRAKAYRRCKNDLEELHELFEEYATDMLGAFEEIQLILDSKLNCCQMLDLKSYVRKQVDDIDEQIRKVEYVENLKHAAVAVKEPLKPTLPKKIPTDGKCGCGDMFKHLDDEEPMTQKIQDLDIGRIRNLVYSAGKSSIAGARLSIFTE